MKKILITLAAILNSYFFGIAQTLSVFDSILDNTINIAVADFNTQKPSQIFKRNNKKSNANISSVICGSSSDIIVQFGDSLYRHDLSSNLDSYITGVVHGISAAFDIIERNNQFNIVTSANWDSIYYFADSSWVYSGFSGNSDSDLIHVGCGINSTFLMGGHLWYFNGSSNPQLIRMNINYAVADLAVDERDNAWILTGSTWPIADTLRIIDSTGHSLCDIPFEAPISTFNGYGMMIHDGKAIVGFGAQNQNFPNSLVSLTIDSINNVVKFENPILIDPKYTIDLGSCSKLIKNVNCTTVNTDESSFTMNDINIYPVPFNEFLNITTVEDNVGYVRVIDLFGRTIIEEAFTTNTLRLNTEKLSKGVYFIQISRKEKICQNFTVVKN